MKIYAPVAEKHEHSFIEVQVSFLPGLPKFTIIGLPDSSLKEGALRIRSALLCHGFDWPRSEQVVVNLKPSGLKKLNKDLELAIVISFLQSSKQVELQQTIRSDKILVVGDLDLQGSVELSKDFKRKTFYNWNGPIIAANSDSDYLFDHYRIKNLSDVKNIKNFFKNKINLSEVLIKPEIKDLWWSPEEARLISLLALGEHSALLGGPQGCGKSTLVKQIFNFLNPPDALEFEEIQELHQGTCKFRPLVQPHHSVPKITLLGGGQPPRPGLVSLAHRGVLVLDEFLEFKKESLEVLREALQENELEIARLGISKKFKSDFQALATTNLCPCGQWDGVKSVPSCSRSIKNCKCYLQRFSGPVLDRFDIFWLKSYSKKNIHLGLDPEVLREQGFIHAQEILHGIETARQFKKSLGRQEKNKNLNLDVILKDLENPLYENTFEFRSSYRRKLSFWRVARTLSELDLDQKISKKNLVEAYKWTKNHFQALI